jgi:hypothetical protein
MLTTPQTTPAVLFHGDVTFPNPAFYLYGIGATPNQVALLAKIPPLTKNIAVKFHVTASNATAVPTCFLYEQLLSGIYSYKGKAAINKPAGAAVPFNVNYYLDMSGDLQAVVTQLTLTSSAYSVTGPNYIFETFQNQFNFGTELYCSPMVGNGLLMLFNLGGAGVTWAAEATVTANVSPPG